MAFKNTASIIRTNVKLTTNVKLNITSDDKIYLNSFDDINTYIQSNNYKNYLVNPNSYYQFDLYNFWGQGNTPSDYIYQIKDNDDTVVKDSFDKQFITDYSYGFEINTNPYFKEEFKFFAPLWIQDTIPDKFVIFRIKGGTYNNVKDDIINNSEIVKVFDLQKSNIGKYINNYIQQDNFPKYPLYVDYNDNNFTRYIGIDLNNGGFVNSAEFNYSEFIKDTPLIYFENFITTGFERNKVVVANLLNLEFLFDDIPKDNDVYKYIGFYVYDNDEKELDIIDFDINNNKTTIKFNADVLNYNVIKDDTSIYYLKNNDKIKKIDKLITDNTTIQYNTEDIKETIINYSDPVLNEKVQYVSGRGRKYVVIEISDNVFDNNYLYIGKLIEERKIIATNELPYRTNSDRYFSNLGTINDVIYAMKKAIEYICPDIICIIKDNKIIICLKEWKITDTYDKIFLNDVILDNSIKLYNNGIFTGKFDATKNKIKIPATDKIFLENNIDNLFVKSINSVTKINQIYLNLDSPIYDNDENIIGFENIDNSLILEFFDIPLINNNQIYFYLKNKCTLGRFSFANIFDFDFDFYNTEYERNIWDWFYLKLFYTNQELTQIYYTNWINYNDTTYPLKKISYTENYNYLDILNLMTIIYNNELYGGNNSITKTNIINDAKNIKQEFYNFMFDNYGVIIEFDLVINSLGELKFNQYDYYKQLITLLGQDNNGIVTNLITNEYDRLKENYTKEYATISRTIPFINKWVKEFNDVKEKKYRLNSNLSFGVDNFTPSFVITTPTPQYYTHEWYYLGEYPKTNNKIIQNYIKNDANFNNDLENIDNFFDTNFDIVKYFKNDYDYFYQYFTIEKITYNDTIGDIQTKYINPKKRFSTFSRENNQDFSQTFFRGIKLYIKTLKNYETINNNLNSLEYIYNNDYIDYKFSAILQPNYYEYDVTWDGSHNITNISSKNDGYKHKDVEFKVIKNEKYKHILFLINIRIPYINSISNNKIILDYNLLYNLKSFCHINGPDIEYLPTPISGAIDLSSSYPGGIYNGIKNNFGATTAFTEEILVNSNGIYDNELFVFEINPLGDDILRYRLTGITDIISDNQIKIENPINVIIPPIESSDEYYKRTALYLKTGGKDYFSRLFSNVSFANIYQLVNYGSEKIQYITIKEDGTILTDTTNFILEFEKPNNLDVVNKLTITEDLNKPNSLLLSTNTIGYNFIAKQDNNLVNINRYKGFYYPKFNNIISFTDIGLIEDDKDKNLQIDFNNSGVIYNYFYNKTSLKTSKNIITVDNTNYKPLYPLVNEIAINKFDKNLFLTTWNNNYFIASYDKTDNRFVNGSFSDIDEKTFFGGKSIKTIEAFGLDVFTPQEIITTLTTTNLKIDFYLENSIINYFYNYVESIISNYIDYTQIQYSTKQEYINNYILKNILPKYYLVNIDLYLLDTKTKMPFDLVSINLTNEQKNNYGFVKITNYQTNFIDNSFFNKSLITAITNNNSNYKYYAVGVNIAKQKYK